MKSIVSIRRSTLSRQGFTLLEILLAVSIAMLLLFVALFTYRQLALLRSALNQQLQQIREAREFLDALDRELHQAISIQSFSGTDHSLRFTCIAPLSVSSDPSLPPIGAWQWNLSIPQNQDGTPAPGLTLQVRPTIQAVQESPDSTSSEANRVPSTPSLPDSGLFSGWPQTPNETDTMALENLNSPNESLLSPKVSSAFTGCTSCPPASSLSTFPSDSQRLMRQFYVRFRYWDKSGWKDQWSGPTPPAGIEVTISDQPLDTTSGSSLTSLPSSSSQTEETGFVLRRFIATIQTGSQPGSETNAEETASLTGRL